MCLNVSHQISIIEFNQKYLCSGIRFAHFNETLYQIDKLAGNQNIAHIVRFLDSNSTIEPSDK